MCTFYSFSHAFKKNGYILTESSLCGIKIKEVAYTQKTVKMGGKAHDTKVTNTIHVYRPSRGEILHHRWARQADLQAIFVKISFGIR